MEIEGERLSYEELVQIATQTAVIQGRMQNQINYLQDYVVAELTENRKQMDTWADGVHKNIHDFREQIKSDAANTLELGSE